MISLIQSLSYNVSNSHDIDFTKEIFINLFAEFMKHKTDDVIAKKIFVS